jgi:hypothetical protein
LHSDLKLREPLPADERYFTPEEFATLKLTLRISFYDEKDDRWKVVAIEEGDDMADDVPHVESWLQHHCNHPYGIMHHAGMVVFDMDARDAVFFRMTFGDAE